MSGTGKAKNRFLTPEEFAQRILKDAEDFAKEHGVPVEDLIGYMADLLGGFPSKET